MPPTEASVRSTNYRRTCTATTKAGHPCRAPVFGDASVCFGHDPERRAERAEARRRGGEGKRNARRLRRMMPSELRPVFDTLAAALDDVLKGALGPRQATAAAALASSMCRVLQIGELEARVHALESESESEGEQ